jgi:crossover junction endodeoxyribonuclease RuvC
MRILGIDPGSRFTGWGLLQREGTRTTYLRSGTLRLESAGPLPARLLRLSEGIEALLGELRPDACALESIFTAKNARTALVLGHARGVIVCAVARRGIGLHEYTAGQVKQAVVGGGRAPKEQVGRMVALLLGRHGADAAPFQEDEADALAVALAHAAASRSILVAAVPRAARDLSLARKAGRPSPGLGEGILSNQDPAAPPSPGIWGGAVAVRRVRLRP